MARPIDRAVPIAELFVRGRYADVIAATVDAAGVSTRSEDAGFVIASLASNGRTDEAEAMLAATVRARSCSPADLAVARFFVGVAACRAGRFAFARATFLEIVASARSTGATPELRFYAWQGLACFRYFSGSMARAAVASRRALQWAFAAGSSFARLLATDLQGHAMVSMGQVKAGLTLLRRAAGLAGTLEMDGHLAAIRIAIATYEARFGGKPPREALGSLEALERTMVHDSYSARSVMLDRAVLLAFMGRGDEAWAVLHEADALVVPSGDERMAIRLAIAAAIVTSMREGDAAARVHIAEAFARLSPSWDRALRVEALCAKAWTASAEEAPALARELEEAYRQTGIARAAVLSRWLARDAERPSSVRVTDFEDDRFGALLLALDDARALGRLLREGYLGLVPRALGIAPGKRLYVVGGAALVIERCGNVTATRPGEGTLRLLRALADGRWHDKETLLADVWGIGVYRPDRHDSVVYMAVARARQALGAERDWLENEQGAYRLGGGAELRVIDDVDVRTSSVEAITGDAASSAIGGGGGDREGALVFVRTHGHVTTGALAKALGVSEMTALRELRTLVDEGVLRRAGRGRATRYELAGDRGEPHQERRS